jgi:lysophospholipid acyltransferase (LPLAT)-like uncharacterized protein
LFEALWKMCRITERDHVAITPDGPRGPRRRVQPGMIFLASRTGLPIMPVGIAYARCWRLGSWDRFAVPYPGSLCYGITAEPIHVPPDASRAQLEEYRLLAENQLHALGELADRWAATGRWPGRAALDAIQSVSRAA